jgi:hypothetical protein
VLNAPPAAPLYRASGFVHWHKADVPLASANVRCWGTADMLWKCRHFRFGPDRACTPPGSTTDGDRAAFHDPTG